MSRLSDLYRPSLALLTDLYQVTMACAAWKNGMTGIEACFALSYRRNPFKGGFAVAAGLETAVDLVEGFRLEAEDLAYLETLRDRAGGPLLDRGFLDHLAGLRLEVDLDAVPEGTPVFPLEPLLRIRGPIIACMLLETPILAAVNFQTLVATKAARVCLAARGEPVMDFGLRRAQGIDGALSASRAAYLGGCAGTSNVLAGRLHGIPVMGTHAHSWVMLFDADQEEEAFRAFGAAMPGNCVLLVDTYDTLEGVRHAIAAGRWLRGRGGDLAGIRLDSGDLAWLSQEARRMLDEAGFEKAVIVGSNELDETVIDSLKEQGARIAVWGVGTRMITGQEDAALGGVYKLSAVRRPGEAWRPRVKLSEQASKVSLPGILQLRRFEGPDGHLADAIWDELRGIPAAPEIVDPLDHTRRRQIPAGTPHRDLLEPVLRRGRPAGALPSLQAIREHAAAELARLHPGIRRFVNPHQYPVGLERGLFDLRTRLVLEARQLAPGAA